MKVETVSAVLNFPQQQANYSNANSAAQNAAVEEGTPAPARPTQGEDARQLMARIDELTENGAYSVRFEKNKDLNDIVIKLVSQESGEVVRQIPPEELIGLTKRLKDLKAVMLDAQG